MRNTVLAPPTGADSPQRGEMSPEATEGGRGWQRQRRCLKGLPRLFPAIRKDFQK